MQTITLDELKESIKLRQAIKELEQVHILFDALAETVFIQTTDEKVANAFYLLQDTFDAKLESIVGMLPNAQ